MARIAHQLEIAQAEMIGLCTHTMHKVAFEIERQGSILFLHIIQRMVENGMEVVILDVLRLHC